MTYLTYREHYRYTELFKPMLRLGLVEWSELDVTLNVTAPLDKIDALGRQKIAEVEDE